MDALKKAVVLLWQYNHLLEKEHDDIRKEFDAVRDLLIRYLGEAKVDERQHPKTMAAMLKVVRSLESRASHMEDFYRERLKTMDAMQAVFTDLAVDATGTRQ
jgi:hypothetical protein